MKHITITPSRSYGRYNIECLYRGRSYSTQTTNTLAIDRYRDDETGATRGKMYNTRNQAATVLYNEIKRANNLR
jgi:hypothetical protein